MNIVPLQSDPSVMEPWGGAWVGIVIPGFILLLSIWLSFWLYLHFVKKVAR